MHVVLVHYPMYVESGSLEPGRGLSYLGSYSSLADGSTYGLHVIKFTNSPIKGRYRSEAIRLSRLDDKGILHFDLTHFIHLTNYRLTLANTNLILFSTVRSPLHFMLTLSSFMSLIDPSNASKSVTDLAR